MKAKVDENHMKGNVYIYPLLIIYRTTMEIVLMTDETHGMVMSSGSGGREIGCYVEKGSPWFTIVNQQIFNGTVTLSND